MGGETRVNRPKVINVYGKTFKIVYRNLDSGLYGECIPSKDLIEIDESLKGRDFMQTLVHEYFHALIDRISLNQILSEDLEEVICDNFATFLIENHLIIIPPYTE